MRVKYAVGERVRPRKGARAGRPCSKHAEMEASVGWAKKLRIDSRLFLSESAVQNSSAVWSRAGQIWVAMTVEGEREMQTLPKFKLMLHHNSRWSKIVPDVFYSCNF